jgi:hypothetical protein
MYPTMKIKFPTAKSLKKSVTVRVKPLKMEMVVKRFLEEDVLDAILSSIDNDSDSGYVNVEVPQEAYKDLKYFYTLCAGSLQPLGYHVEGSHDGVGEYNTLYVTWR